MTYLSHILATSFLLLILAFTVVAVPYEAGVDGPEPQPPLPRGPPPPEDQSQQEQPWPGEHEHPNPHPHHNHGHGHKLQPTKPDPKRKKPKFGISYSPYTSAGTCKTQEQVDHDLAAISKTEQTQGANDEDDDDDDDNDIEYGFVRIYGTDCNQTATVSRAARRYNMRVFAGVFDLNGFPGSLDPIIQVGTSPSRSHSKEDDDDDNWSIFHTISIGNELIQKTNTPDTIHSVTEALHEARSILRSKGYKGPVVTVDTYSILLEHPEVCHASDYCATNCHVFFDATQGPHGAGTYARDVARKISQKAGGKRTVIAESGWPHAGLPNGKAVPGVEEQRAAIGNLKQVFGQEASGDDGDAGLVLFTAFDDLWKEDNEGTFGAERFWGIH